MAERPEDTNRPAAGVPGEPREEHEENRTPSRPDSSAQVEANGAQAPTELAVAEPATDEATASIPADQEGPRTSTAGFGVEGSWPDSFSDQEKTRFGLVGTILEGRYSIKRRLGEGGMGIVYEARHVNLDKEVAVKVLLPELSNIPGVSERFEREARSLSRLDHPGIVRVMDFGQTRDGLCYLVMDYVEGKPLSKILQEEAPLPVERAVSLARQILLALAHAHEIGIVHRDLKPDNIMVVSPGSPQENIRILDFGIAKMLETEDGQQQEGTQPLTRAGMVFGTPEYLAPEQAAGEPDLVDARSDLYTVGVILFEMLTGKRPFEAPNRMALLNQHITKTPPRLSEAAPGRKFPPALEDIVARALAKDREKRFQSALEFYEALSSLPIAQPALSLWPGAVPQGMQEPRTRSPRRGSRRRRLAVAAVLLVVVAAVAGYAGLRWGRHRAGNPKKTTKTEDVLQKLTKELDQVIATAPKEVQPELRKARAHLVNANPIKALRILGPLAEKYPDVAAVHFLRGRAFAAYLKWSRALDAYARAVELDPSLKKNPLLQDDLVTMGLTRKPELHKKLVRFLDEHMGPEGRDVVQRIAARYEHYALLRELSALGTKYGYEDAVDRVKLYRLMLKQSPRCHERGAAAEALARALGPKALPDLQEALHRKPWRYGRRKLDNDCIKVLLQQLIRQVSSQ